MKDEDKSPQIVWVEMGRPYPSYARNNSGLIGKFFPNLRQILFTDRKVSSLEIDVVYRDSIDKSDLTIEFEKMKKEWPFKQEYFWQGTTSRFFHLYDLARSLKVSNILHLETDSLILDPSPFIDIMKQQEIQLAYPLQADGIGCASILWIREADSLRPFLQFVLENWDKNQVDDMGLLGEYSKSYGVFCLPTWTNSTNFEGFIFDAVSVGRYFLGTDARNMRIPFARRGLKDYRRGSISNNLDSKEIEWNIRLKDKKIEVSGTHHGVKFQLANVHIHSKIIPKSVAKMTSFLERSFRTKKGIAWKLGRFDGYVFRERLHSFVRRRLLRKYEDTEKIFR